MKVYPKIPSKRLNKWVHDRRNRWVIRVATIGFVGFLAFTVLVVGAFAWFSKDLPSPYKLTNRQVEQSTQIFDRNGVLLYDIYGDKNRTLVELKDIPQYLKDATIATEDKNFYSHSGFDLGGIVRSAYDITTGKGTGGGSTLTQQLVKNALLTNERSLTRKIKELILSVQIEKRYSKDEILQIYFNEIPYGGTAWGAEAGARQYFGKDVKDLNLLESAILAGLPQEPSYYSPFGAHPDAYKDRTKYVLQRMEEDGYITKDQQSQALKDLETYKVPGAPSGLLKAPHFVLYVKDLLEAKYGEQTVLQGGLKVYTSLDSKLQDTAQQIVHDQVASEGSTYHYSNGAAMVLNPKTGEILAMVGSKDYFATDYDGQFNVTTATRQPGSSIKPINYVTGLKNGYTAATLFVDAPTSFPCGAGCPDGKYTPMNYDHRFGHGHNGLILMRDALAESLNIPAVKMLALNGLPAMLDTAHDMGITTLNDTSSYGLSLTLGGGEVKMIDMMGVYSAFANGGMRVEPTAILKVTDSSGKVLEKANLTPERRVLDPGLSFIMSDMLADYKAKLPAFGTAAAANFVFPNHEVAVKTGTTDDIRDNWTFGYTPSYVVGTWVGNNDNSPINGRFASGVTGGAPMWHKIFTQLFSMYNVPQEQFQMPDDVVKMPIDPVTGVRVASSSKYEYFTKSTVPGFSSATQQTLRICSDEKKLATPADEAAGMAIDQQFVKVGDPFSPGVWAPFDPPTDYCDIPRGQNGSSIVVSITAPANGANVGSNINVQATATGPNPISQVQFFFDGSLACSDNHGPNFSCSFNLSGSTQHGTHTITARAMDNQGNAGDSSAISVNYTGVGGPVLGDTTNCFKNPKKCFPIPGF